MVFLKEEKISSKLTTFVITLLKFDLSHSKWRKLKSCCSEFCIMGIETAIVLNPVFAARVLVTAESTPPETPITRVTG